MEIPKGSYRFRGEFHHPGAHSNERPPNAQRPNEIHPVYRWDGELGTTHSPPHPGIHPPYLLEDSSNYFLSARQMGDDLFEAIAATGIWTASRCLSSF
jgi:hypothetical protein